MNYLTTDLIEALAKKQDIEEIFRHHLEKAINQLLKHELTAFLNYEPYTREGFHSGNSRNGFYDCTFKTEYGELQLAIPRDRNGEFQQETLAPYQRSNDTLEQFVIHLYEKGITTDEIADLMERMYGGEMIQHLQAEGLEQVLLFISDGLPGMTDAIHRVYPKAKHQVCCVHVARNITVKCE